MNEIKVYRCEKCGLIVTPNTLKRMCESHFLPSTDGEWGAPCYGEFVERILADPAEARRETVLRLGELIHDDQIEWPNTITAESIDEALRALDVGPWEVEDE